MKAKGQRAPRARGAAAVEHTLPWDVVIDVAVVGCVDGDADALEQLLAELHRQGIFRLWHVGDLLGPDPTANARVIELLLQSGAQGVQGASDLSADGLAAIAALPPVAQTYIESLPRERRFAIGGSSVHLFHGSPRRIDEPLGPDTRDHFLARIGRRSEAQILVYGCSHRAYWRAIGERLFLDVGAVAPAGGRSSYGVIQLGRRPPLVKTCFVAELGETAAEKHRSAGLTDRNI